MLSPFHTAALCLIMFDYPTLVPLVTEGFNPPLKMAGVDPLGVRGSSLSPWNTRVDLRNTNSTCDVYGNPHGFILTFHHCDVRHGRLIAPCEAAEFVGCNLSGASLSLTMGHSQRNVYFLKCLLRRTEVRIPRGTTARFVDCDLRGVVFDEMTDFSSMTFTNCNLGDLSVDDLAFRGATVRIIGGGGS